MEGGDLARLWKGGKKGRLSPLMQAKAWGLNEAGVLQVDRGMGSERAPRRTEGLEAGASCLRGSRGPRG